MAKINMHPMNVIADCLAMWLADSGQWTPTMHQYPRPIFDHQDGPTIMVGGIILAGMVNTTIVDGNQLFMVDTLIVRSTAADPAQLGMDGTEIVRLDHLPKEPGHIFILKCASTVMSVYYGMISGDLARFGRPQRGPACRAPGPWPGFPSPDTMVSCPDCGGMLFPGQVDHPWPVYRYQDMRLIHRIRS